MSKSERVLYDRAQLTARIETARKVAETLATVARVLAMVPVPR